MSEHSDKERGEKRGVRSTAGRAKDREDADDAADDED
jgi:hypothetical protein